VEGLGQLYQNFRLNYDGLNEDRRSEVLLYALTIKLSKFEDFKKRERTAFEMVKNLFTFPGRFNKEQLELFSASFIQNTQACMSALEKGGDTLALRDMENKLFASLLWAITFGAGVETELKPGVEEIWESLAKFQPKLKHALAWVQDSLNLDDGRLALYRKASQLSVEEIVPQLSV